MKPILPRHIIRTSLASALLCGSLLASRGYALDPAQRGPQSLLNMLAPARERTETGMQLSANTPETLTPRTIQTGARAYPVPALERVDLRVGQAGTVLLSELPRMNTLLDGKVASMTARNEFVFYTLNPDLQSFAQNLVQSAKAPHVAFVAMDPASGRILAMSGKSSSLVHPELYAGFPAASLFKLVTSTAAVERAGLSPETMIGFRGGTYTLNAWNYAPGMGRDTRLMSLSEALARSCNPVFSRVAIRFLNPEVLRSYVRAFGFNTNLRFDLPLPPSAAKIPDEGYELGKTAAGFGEVTFSPIHAAAVMGGIANGGLMLRPALIESVVAQDGAVIYQQHPETLTRLMAAGTAQTLLSMMEKTTTIGTSRRAFMVRNSPLMPDIPVAAKTGTLRGDNPEGINNWFVAAAPAENPRLAVAVLVVHPLGNHLKASQLGRQFIQKFFNRPVSALELPGAGGKHLKKKRGGRVLLAHKAAPRAHKKLRKR